MRYKLWGAAACAGALLLALIVPAVVNADDGHGRYHQHLEAAEKTEDRTSSAFSTHLPLVEIDTGGAEIPGKVFWDENGMNDGYTTAEDGAETITAQLRIVDHETTYNHVEDAPTLTSAVEIHVRGNSSRAFEKSNYALRLVNEDGTNNPQSVMGMAAHHEWVLHGPYLDKTLLRNYMWYNIGGEIMDYAPDVRFCEVLLNGEYRGVYVMMESVTAGDDGARLNLSVSAKNNTFSGFLLRLDRGSSDPMKVLNHFTAYTERTQQSLNIVYPGSANLTPEIANGICQDFSDFESALYSYDYDDAQYGYPATIDTTSFVDYFLINELTCNYDAGIFSTYIYKDTSGKYRMCLWDMNSCCDNYQEGPVDVRGFQMQNRLWYFMLTKDEDFTDALINRYWKLRDSYFSEEYLNRYIDETIAYLGDAVERNYEKWGDTFTPEYDLMQPAERNPRSYEEAVGQMKMFLAERIAWMDENIETLRQYSAESKVKKFNENAN